MAEAKIGDLTEQIAEIAECPICTDKIKNNRMLPCGHTFCLKCLEQYKKASKVKGKSLSCPICRRDFAIPRGGCAMFPKNIIVEKLLEVENAGKDEDDVRPCDTCETGYRSNAVVHCIECDQSLCGECEKLHGRLKVSATHHVVPVSKNSHFHAARRTYCEDHPDYLLELMCYDCDKTICWKCMSLKHANHKAADMKDLADGYCEQLQSNIEQIDSRLSVLSKITENITDQERQYQENFEKDKVNVSKASADLIRSVVSNEDNLVRQLSFALQRNLKSLQPHKQQVQAQIDSLKQHKTSVKELKESGDSLKILEGIADLHSRADELLSASIISINEPILSTMTESEIQKHLIGASVATTADATATSQTVTTTGTVFRNKPLPTTRTTLRKPESLPLQSPQDDRNAKGASESQPDSPLQAAAGTIYRGKSLPPATLKKPELKHSQSVQSQAPDDRSMKAEGESKSLAASADTPTSEIYSNFPPLPLPPELPLRSILPLSRSASGGSTQSSKAVEQQPPAKDVGSTTATNNGSSVASFSVGDGSAVFGVAVQKQKIYVATENSPDISVYSVEEHSLLHTLVVPGLKQASDMTFCHRNNCLYLIDWIVRSIFRVEVEGGKEITRWNTEEFGGLSISAEATVILAGHDTNCLKEYTTSGTLIRTVKLKSDISESIRPWHAVKLAFDHGTLQASDRFLVSHGSSSDTALHRVCLVDADGQVIKSFGGLRGRGKNSLSGPYHLCITEDKRLFIADCNNGRIVVLDENLEFVDEIAGNLRRPRRICLDKTSNKLFVTDNKLAAKKASDGRIVILSEVLYSQTFCLA